MNKIVFATSCEEKTFFSFSENNVQPVSLLLTWTKKEERKQD